MFTITYCLKEKRKESFIKKASLNWKQITTLKNNFQPYIRMYFPQFICHWHFFSLSANAYQGKQASFALSFH